MPGALGQHGQWTSSNNNSSHSMCTRSSLLYFPLPQSIPTHEKTAKIVIEIRDTMYRFALYRWMGRFVHTTWYIHVTWPKDNVVNHKQKFYLTWYFVHVHLKYRYWVSMHLVCDMFPITMVTCVCQIQYYETTIQSQKVLKVVIRHTKYIWHTVKWCNRMNDMNPANISNWFYILRMPGSQQRYFKESRQVGRFPDTCTGTR